MTTGAVRFARPELARLWQAAHRRLDERDEIDARRVVVVDPTADERIAIDRLLGRRSAGRTTTITLAQLDTALLPAGTSLREVVTRAVGPITGAAAARRSDRERTLAAEAAMWAEVAEHPALTRHPQLAGWVDVLRRSGTWRRSDEPARRLLQALDVVAVLPSNPSTSRARLAATLLHDSHALDDTRPVGRLVDAALASLAAGSRRAMPEPATSAEPSAGDASRTAAQDDSSSTGAQPIDGAAIGRRQRWRAMGVELDDTSSTVLTRRLRPQACGPLTTSAGTWADADVPLVLTLHAVEYEPWTVAPGTVVWVCENPSVLAATAGLDAPIVAVEGQPSVAAIALLTSLRDSGADLRYHGDFGAGGVTIANRIIGAFGAQPWRMSAVDHAAALRAATVSGRELPRLRGPVPDAVWDADLSPAIRACGVEVEEELLLDMLLADLDPTAPG